MSGPTAGVSVVVLSIALCGLLIGVCGQPFVAPPSGMGSQKLAVAVSPAGSNVAAVAFSPAGGGWETTSSGVVTPFGGGVSYGSVSEPLNKPIVGMASTWDGEGYWLVASDGGIFAFGDAVFYGSQGGHPLNKPIVGIAATSDGKGYWLVASDGGIFAFGDAAFHGSEGGHRLNKPIVGMAATSDGEGYWLVASDGGLFSFGDAHFYGSEGGHPLNKPIVAMARAGSSGYWLVASDGGLFSFGDAAFYGSEGGQPLGDPIVGMIPTVDGFGYSLISQDGLSYPFGDAAQGSIANSWASGSCAAPDTTALQGVISESVASSLDSDVNAMVAQQTPGDEVGLWIGGDPVYWRSSSGPGLAAAAGAALTGNATMQYDAVQTLNTLIQEHQQANGSFTAVAGTPDPQSPSIDTMFFVTNLGMALWALRSQLSAEQATYWSDAITGGADFLIAAGNLTWYANGNINVGNALAMELAYCASGESQYQADYEAALSFAIAPPQSRWPGYGLIYTTVPTEPNGSDGAAYFAESGGGAPGFDAYYTQLQLDQLCRLYLVTDSPDILRLIQLLFNQEWPLVNTSTWTLYTGGGTRHPQLDQYGSLTTPALELLVVFGDRTDLSSYVASQVEFIETFFAGFTTNWSPSAEYAYGLEAATFALLGL